jgi:hypothetical protein
MYGKTSQQNGAQSSNMLNADYLIIYLERSRRLVSQDIERHRY